MTSLATNKNTNILDLNALRHFSSASPSPTTHARPVQSDIPDHSNPHLLPNICQHARSVQTDILGLNVLNNSKPKNSPRPVQAKPHAKHARSVQVRHPRPLQPIFSHQHLLATSSTYRPVQAFSTTSPRLLPSPTSLRPVQALPLLAISPTRSRPVQAIILLGHSQATSSLSRPTSPPGLARTHHRMLAR